jgi:hypothetical protein
VGLMAMLSAACTPPADGKKTTFDRQRSRVFLRNCWVGRSSVQTLLREWKLFLQFTSIALERLKEHQRQVR